MDKKRIMFVLDSFWPNQDGVSTVVQYLAGGMVQKGYEILVLTNAKDRDLPKEEQHQGYTIRRMKILTHWPMVLQPMDSESDIKAYQREIETFQPDVIVIESLRSWTNDWFVKFADQISATKILHLHSDILNYKEFGLCNIDYSVRNIGNILYQSRMQLKMRLYWKRIEKHLRKYNKILFLTDVHENIVNYGKKRERTVFKLENAVDDIFFEESMRHFYRQEELTQFLCVANYMERKNHKFLLQAYDKAIFQKKTRLVIVGNGSKNYMNDLKGIANEILSKENNANKDILFYRGLSRDEVVKLYIYSDVFVLSSFEEESPIVIREAAACGMPIISTDVGDVRCIDGCEVVNTVTEMAQRLEEYSSQKRVYEQKSVAACEWAEKHCRKKVIVDIFEKIIKEDRKYC